MPAVVTPEGGVILQFLDPYLSVPRVAEGAATLGVSAAAFAGELPEVLEYRHHPSGESAPDWQVTHWLPATMRSVTDYVTFSGLDVGTTYVFQVRLNHSDDLIASTEIFWTGGVGLFPAVDTSIGNADRLWSWEEHVELWLAASAWYYRDDPLILSIFRRFEEEFQRLQTAFEQVTRAAFPSLAYGDSLDGWADLFDLDLPSSIPETQRRRLILSMVQARVRSSAQTFEAMLGLLLGDTPNIREFFADYRVFVDVPPEGPLRAAAQTLISRIKPAHIEVVYETAGFLLGPAPTRKPIPGVWPRYSSPQPGDSQLGFDSGELG